jgi:hypothetical protein
MPWLQNKEDVDARNECGHDEKQMQAYIVC